MMIIVTDLTGETGSLGVAQLLKAAYRVRTIASREDGSACAQIPEGDVFAQIAPKYPSTATPIRSRTAILKSYLLALQHEPENPNAAGRDEKGCSCALS